MFILQRNTSDCGYCLTENLAISSDKNELIQAQKILNEHLQNDLNTAVDILTQKQEYLNNNPQPSLSVPYTQEELERLNVWRIQGTNFHNSIKAHLFHTDASLETLQSIEYTIEDVPSAQSFLKTIS